MSKQPKESHFSKKSKADSEKRAKDQAAISKAIAAYHKKWNDPIIEEDNAHEAGIEVGKKHSRLNFEDAVRKEAEKRLEEVTAKTIEQAKTLVEAEVEDRLKNMDLKELTAVLMKKIQKTKQTAIVCVVDLNERSGEGIVGAYGSAKDCAKVLTLAAKAHDHMEHSVILAARNIMENNLDKTITKVINLDDNGKDKEKDDCDCPACRVRRILAKA